RAAADVHLPNTFNLKQPLLHNGGGRVVELTAAVDVRRERNDQDRRIGRINFSPGGILRKVRRKVRAGGITRRVYIARRAVDVTTKVELQRDARETEITCRRHFGEARHV